MNRPFRPGKFLLITALLCVGLLICVAAADEPDTTPDSVKVIGFKKTHAGRSDAPVTRIMPRPITRYPHAPILTFEPDPSVDYKILVWEPPPRDYRIIDAAPRSDNHHDNSTRDDVPRSHPSPRFRFRNLVPDLPERPLKLPPRLR